MTAATSTKPGKARALSRTFCLNERMNDAVLAEPLEQHVAAQRDADGADADQRLALGEQADDGVEVVGVAGVIKARPPVGLAAARPEVQRDGAPARRARERQQAADVVRVAGALEAVEHQEQRRAGRRARVEPVEVDEVTVGRDDPLAPGRHAVPARERAPHGLRVAVTQPPRRAERYSCPLSSSVTICGAISRARRSSSASVRLAIGWGIARNL